MLKKNNIQDNFIILILFTSLFGFFVQSNIITIISFNDLALVLYLIYYIFFKRHLKISTHLTIFIGLYYFYSIVLTTVLLLESNLTFVSYLYIIKEYSYLITYFIVIEANNRNKNLTNKIINMMVIINLFYGTISLVFGNIVHYGIGTIASDAPSQSGIIYISCTIISIINFLKTKNKKYIIYSLLGILSIIGTVSRTAILGIMIFIMTQMILNLTYILKNYLIIKYKVSKIYRYILLVLFIMFIAFLVNRIEIGFNLTFINKAFYRLTRLSKSASLRKEMSSDYLNIVLNGSVLKLIFGQGKAIPEILTNRTTLGVDNQYTRLIIEIGMVGFFLWILQLATMSRQILKQINYKFKIIFFSVIVMFLSMGLGYEIFQVTKGGISFWLILSVISTTDIKNQKYNEYNLDNIKEVKNE